MDIGAYIKENQPLVYRTFLHAFEGQKLAHAYLLCGESGVPLKETALYFAKSILCDHPSPFADLSCRTCHRIDEGNYADFRSVDGSANSIKKDDMGTVVETFQQTPFEKKGIMVYVVHEVENMTAESINSVLKFLEEPTPNTYAILTTRNEAKVLPTILSRCQTIRMHLAPREDVEARAKAIGVADEDAELLSFFFNDATLVSENAGDEAYQATKASLISFLDATSQGKDMARLIMEKDVIPVVNSKASARLFFDMMTLFLKDASSLSKGGTISLKAHESTIQDLVKSLPNIDKNLLALMTLRGEIETNIQIGLLLSHLAISIFKE